MTLLDGNARMFRDKVFSRRRFLAGLGALPLAAINGSAARSQSPSRIEIEGAGFFFRGRPLRLTGIAVGDPIYIRAQRPAFDYRKIARDWFANCVRISVFPGHWRSDPVGTATALTREVALARAENLFVIIDWHAIGFPGYYEPTVPAEWGLPPDIHVSSLEDAASFWRAMARCYAHDPCILFELWNEPTISATLWKATGEHWPLFHAAWTDLVAVIRNEADNLTICAGGYWAHDLVGVCDRPIEDSRTAYAWHSYPNAERGDFAARLTTLDGLQRIRPVIVTEWGFCPECTDDLHGTVDDFGRQFVENFLEEYQMSHTAWCFSQGAMPNLLDAHDEPSTFGRFVQATLKRSSASASWQLSQ